MATLDYTINKFINFLDISADNGTERSINKGKPSERLQNYTQAADIMSRLNKKKNLKGNTTQFEKYLTVEEVDIGLKIGRLFEGYLYVSSKNLLEAVVITKDRTEITIWGLCARNRAFDGDRVVVKIIYEHPKSKLTGLNDTQQSVFNGEVVFIKEANNPRTLICDLYGSLCYPRGVQKPVIRLAKSMHLNASDRSHFVYEVEISNWESANQADGKIIKCLGRKHFVEAETECAFKTYNCQRVPYCIDYKKYYPEPSTFEIPLYDRVSRVDLRSYCTFTIDPTWAADLDDALSVRELENGNCEIGVHIADVTYFFRPDTPFDNVIRLNASSLYFDHKVYHLLPEELVDLISLTPGKDKLTISLFWEFTPDGTIVSNRISRSIINSCAQLSYENVQAIIMNKCSVSMLSNFPKIHNGYNIDACAKNLRLLLNIASRLNVKRIGCGYILMQQDEIRFDFDKNGNIDEKILLIQHDEAHMIVEEFMLLSNITIGTVLYAIQPDLVLLRSHAMPDEYSFSCMKQHLLRLGVRIDIRSIGSFYKSLLNYKDDKSKQAVIHNVIYRYLPSAKYCSSISGNLKHFGLNVSLFTNFTSPIRRYADQVVHRLLASGLGYTGKLDWSPNYIKEVAVYVNRSAERFSRLLTDVSKSSLYTYLSKYRMLKSKCLVISLTATQICVVSLEYHFKISVPLILLQMCGCRATVVTDNSNNVILVNVLWSNHEIQKVTLLTELYVEQYINKSNKIEGRLSPPNLRNITDVCTIAK